MPDAITQTLDRIGGSRRILLIVVGLGTLAVIWGFAQWGMAPSMVPIATDLPMARMSAATDQLDQAGIKYALQRGGSVIAVAEPDAARARVALAAAGLDGVTARPGFELFDQPSWGMTDFTQRVNYRRALEGELERTLGHMQGVNSAQVHLTMQEPSYLKSDNRPPEASVVLDMGPGDVGAQAAVEGVQFLVASAVDGLAPENVTVMDDRGRLLSNPPGQKSVGMSDRQLQVRRQIESYLESKAMALVDEVVGPHNASVRVSADLNFDQVDRTTRGVNPDQQATVSEDRAEITPANQQQGAGSVTTNTVYENAHTVETVSHGGAELQRLTVAVVLGEKRIKARDGSVTYQSRDPAETTRIEALVKNAVGFNARRGDEISVVSAPIEPPAPPEPTETGPGFMGSLLQYQRPLIALAGLLVALVVIMKILASFRAMAPRHVLPAPGRERALPSVESQSGLGSVQAAPALAAGPAEAPAPQVTDPDMTARVIRAWMKDA